MKSYENDSSLNDFLKISSDLTEFYRYSFYPMITIIFAIFAIASFVHDELLTAMILTLFFLPSLIFCIVNPYRKLAKLVVNFQTKTFVVEEMDNEPIEIGIAELEKYSISQGICKLYFRNRKVVSFLLPSLFENPPKHTVIGLLKEAILEQMNR